MSESRASAAQIVVDWRPVLWSLVWSWIIMFIPTIVIALRVGSTSFALANDAVTIRVGIMTKKSTYVELYRVRDISTSDNAFTGGRVTLTMQDGSSNTLTPIKDADAVGAEIRRRVTEAKTTRGVQTREDL